MRSCPILLSMLFISLAAPRARASGGFIVSTLGIRRVSMQANMGRPDDLTTLYHNPAGLADLPGTRMLLFVGPAFLGNSTKLQALDPDRFPEINSPGCGEAGNDPCSWPIEDGYYTKNFKPERYLALVPYLGASTDLGFISDRARDVVVGLAAYAPGAYGASLPADGPSSYFITDGLFLVTSLTAGAGWRITDWISVGVNLSYNYMRLGFGQKFSLADVLTPEGQKPAVDAVMAQAAIGDLKFDFTGVDHGLGWGAGVLVTPQPWISVGLSYAGATSAKLEGDVGFASTGSKTFGTDPLSDERLVALIGDQGYKLPHALEVEIYIPPSFSAGVNVAPTWWLELGLDYRWYGYSLSKEEPLRPIYDPNEPGEEPLTEEGLTKTTDYNNSWELSVGVLVRPLKKHRFIELMTGFSYYTSPVPDEWFTIDNPSMNQRIISVGGRARITDQLRAGVSYMLTIYTGRDVTNSMSSPPTNVKISGMMHLPTIEAEWIF